MARNLTPTLNTGNELFELTSSSDIAQGEMYSDIQLEDQNNDSYRVQRSKKTSNSIKISESNKSDMEEKDQKGKSNALKAFAESHFGESKFKSAISEDVTLPSNQSKLIEPRTVKEGVSVIFNNVSGEIKTVQLKKAEIIKRPIVTPKVETVQLKHHNFEHKPQEPEIEQTTNIKLTKPLKQKLIETDAKHKKNKKLKKRQRKDSEIDSEPTINVDSEVYEKENSSKSDTLILSGKTHFGISEGKVIKQTDLICDINEHKLDAIKEIDERKQKHVSKTTEVKEKDDDDDENDISTSIINSQISKPLTFRRMNSKQRKRTPMVMPMPIVKPAKISNEIEAILETEEESSETENIPLSDVFNVSVEEEEPNRHEKEMEEVLFFSRQNLKKVEPRKISIEKIKIEKVDLYHHEFESIPQDNNKEQNGIIILGVPLYNYEDNQFLGNIEIAGKEKEHKSIQKKRKQNKKKVLIDKIPYPILNPQVEEVEESLPEVTKRKDSLLGSRKSSTSTMEPEVGYENIQERMTPNENNSNSERITSSVTRKGKLLTIDIKELPEVQEEKIASLKYNLKKTETKKSEIEKSKLPDVLLKHHDFEKYPQENVKEEVSNVHLGKHIYFYDEGKQIKKRKPQNVITEEVTKNERKEKESGEKKMFPLNCANDSLTQPIFDTEVVLACV